MTARDILLKQRTWDLITELNKHVASGLITKETLALISAVQQLLPEERPQVAPMRIPAGSDDFDLPEGSIQKGTP